MYNGTRVKKKKILHSFDITEGANTNQVSVIHHDGPHISQLNFTNGDTTQILIDMNSISKISFDFR
jgi:hypothetical protein